MLCRHCGHEQSFHQHYRDGTDCSIRGCACRKFGRQWPRWLEWMWKPLW